MKFHYHEEPIDPQVYWNLAGGVIGMLLAVMFQYVIP